MEGFLFKNLVVWQRAVQLTKLVYELTRAFPAEEKYALVDQIRRAAVSISSNIAEGNGRAGNRDYAHFLAIARGSLYETISQLELAVALGYLSDYSSIEPLASEISKMLTAMLQKYGELETK